MNYVDFEIRCKVTKELDRNGFVERASYGKPILNAVINACGPFEAVCINGEWYTKAADQAACHKRWEDAALAETKVPLPEVGTE